MFEIDGFSWPFPCNIERVSEITPSEISGMMLDKNYFNDVLGTYLQYSVTIAVPINQRDKYSELYEYINEPVDGHTFIFPYNQGTVTITGRIESISDVYVRLAGGGVYWKGISFTVISNHPTKEGTLARVIQRGRATVPEIAVPTEGVVYTWHNGHWESSVEYKDADSIRF